MELLFSQKSVEKIEQIIGYSFHNKLLLQQAFTRDSYCNEQLQAHKETTQSNELLEFIGDKVLGMVIVNQLSLQNGEVSKDKGYISSMSEGDMTVIELNLSNKYILSQCVKEHNLQQFLLASHGDRLTGNIDSSDSIKEDLFESIIGAVYLDAGRDIAIASKVVFTLLDPKSFLTNGNRSYKTMIKEYCEQHHIEFFFDNYQKEGMDHCPSFTVELHIGENVFKGKGSKKAKAEEEASQKAYEFYGEGEKL